MNRSESFRQAALIVSTLDRHSIDAILERLPESHAFGIRQALMELDSVPDDEQRQVLQAFLRTSPHRQTPASPIRSAHTAATEAVRKNSDDGPEQIQGNNGRERRIPASPPRISSHDVQPGSIANPSLPMGHLDFPQAGEIEHLDILDGDPLDSTFKATAPIDMPNHVDRTAGPNDAQSHESPRTHGPFDQIGDQELICAIRHERHSVMAAVLHQLPGKRTARILQLLAPMQRNQIVEAFAIGIRPIPEFLEALANSIVEHHHVRNALTVDHRAALYDILVELSPEEQQTMLRQLADLNPTLAAQLADQSAKKLSV